MSRDALVVGLNHYQVLPSLGAPARDAEAIAQRLSQDGDFRVQRLPEIIQAGQPKIGQRTPLTVQQLETALVKLFKPKGPTVPDTALFYFSGHGLQKEQGIHEGYLATSDVNPEQSLYGLSLFWLRRLLQESPVRQRVIWLDCCHSGALLNFSEVDPGAQPGTSRFLMAASREYEAAYESLQSEYSVLTEALLEGLVPQRLMAGCVTNYALTDWVSTQLKGELQQPLFENSGGEIVLTRARVLAAPSGAKTIPDSAFPDSAQAASPAVSPAASQSVPPSAPPPSPAFPPCPFPGLHAFSLEQAYAFTGRDELVQTLLEALFNHSLVSIVGGASSGKTSLIQAGLLPALQRQTQTPWLLKSVHLGQHNQPLLDLAAAFVDAQTTEWERGEQMRRNSLLLASDTRGLLQLVRTLRPSGWMASRVKLLLVLDPFEALLQPSTDRDMEMIRQHVVANLVTLLQEESDWVRVAIAVRSDYWEACYPITELLHQGPSQLITVDPLSGPALEAAIVKPLQRVGWQCEALLPAVVLADIATSPARMALVQLVLHSIWEAQAGSTPDRIFRLKTYAELGGIRGLLVHQATQLLSDLSPSEQSLVQRIFLALTQLGDGAPDSLRMVSKLDLGIGPTPRGEELAAMLETLIESRLVASGGVVMPLPPDLEPEVTFLATRSQKDWVQASHEALIRDWPDLRQWLKTDRDRLTQQRWIEAAAKEWCDRNELFSGEGWLQGTKLRAAEAYLRNHPEDLSSIAQHYIHLSQKENQKLRHSSRLLQVGLPSALTATLFAVVHQYWSGSHPPAAQTLPSRQAAQKILANDEADPTPALLLSRWTMPPSPEQVLDPASDQLLREALRSMQLRAEYKTRTAPRSLQWSSQQPLIAGIDPMGQAYFWKVGPILDQQQSARIQQKLVWPQEPAATRASRLMQSLLAQPAMASAGSLQTTRNVGVGPDLQRFAFVDTSSRPVAEVRITGLSLSPTGDQLAAMTPDRPEIAIWSLPSGQVKQVLTDLPIPPEQILYSPTQPRLAAIAGRLVYLWDTEGTKPRFLGTLDHDTPVEQMQFSEDGRYLLTSGGDRRLRLWDLETGIQELELSASTPITQIRLSPKLGPQTGAIAAVGHNGTLYLWDRATGELRHQLRVTASLQIQTGQPQQLDFSTDGSQVISVQGNRAWLWDAATGELQNLLQLTEGADVPLVRLKGDRTQLLAIQPHAAQLWDLKTGHRQAVLREADEASDLLDARFSPDGNTLVTVNARHLQFWDAQPGYELPPLHTEGIRQGFAQVFPRASVEPILEPMAAASSQSEAQPAPVPDRLLAPLRWLGLQPRQPFQVRSTRPTGLEFLLLDSAGQLNRWNIPQGFQQETAVLDIEPHSPIQLADWTGDFQTVATAHANGDIQVWDLRRAEILVTDLDPLDATVNPNLDPDLESQGTTDSAPSSPALQTLELSPEGRSLLAIDRHQQLHLWDTDSGQQALWPQALGAIASAQFSHDGRRLLTVSPTGTVTLWAVKTGKQLHRFELPGIAIAHLDPSGKTLAATFSDGALTLIDLKTGQTQSLGQGPEPGAKMSPIRDLAFSPEGQQLATGHRDGTVRLWSIKTGQITLLETPLETPQDVTEGIVQVTYSPDGQFIAAVNTEGTVAFWAATAKSLRKLARDRSFRQLTPQECLDYLQLSAADCPRLPLQGDP